MEDKLLDDQQQSQQRKDKEETRKDVSIPPEFHKFSGEKETCWCVEEHFHGA